jgi:hypothetical protein
MSKNGRGFKSLADAAGALQELRASLTRSSATPPGFEQQPQRPAGAFADLEQQMLAKQMAGQRDSRGRHAVAASPAPQGDQRHSKRSQQQRPNGKKAKPQTGPKGAKKILLKAPGLKAAYQALLEEERAAQIAAAKPPAIPHVPTASREMVFRKVIAAVRNTTPAIEPRPAAISARNRAVLERAIAEGAIRLAENPLPDVDGYIVGFDFGTSSVKLAVSQPYHADNPTKAMPAPEELRSFAHPYLWHTALWFDPAGNRFSLFPIAGAVALEGFKTGIIGAHGGERVRPDIDVTRVEAAAAFLALHFAHFLGWYHGARPLGATGANEFLAVNIGIPVAAHDDAKSYAVFKRIVAAGFALGPFATDLDKDLVRQTYAQSGDQLPEGFYLIPELAAAVAGYAFEPTSQPGSHMLVDVGASTLDIVAFNLVGRERVAVFSAAVELLGAAALDTALHSDVSAQEFKQACDYEFEQVYGHARSPERARDGFHIQCRRKPVQLLVTGGGCQTELHNRFIAEMPVERVLGAAPLIRPLPPEAMTDLACDRARLLLAYGLTRDLPDLPEIRLPSQVPSITPPARSEPSFIGPEMT